jgi:2-isopropylmalate synthase
MKTDGHQEEKAPVATERVFILDTTLRDGEQAPGFHLNAAAKLRIARQLERLGVDVIDAGFPIQSAGDFDACRRIAREVRGVTVTALARADKEEIDTAWSAIKDAATPQLHIVVPSSDLHIERKMGMTRAEVLAVGREMIAYARSLCDLVQYSAEDAGRADVDYLVEMVEAMIVAGAGVVNLADTTGYCLPTEFGDLVKHVRGHARGAEGVLFSVHCHDDLGLATANAKAGVLAGARRVECTVNGIGERAGNTSLEEIVMLIKVRGDRFGLETAIDTTEIMRTSRLVSELTGTPVQPNKAVVGANAFSHAGAIQQEGVLKERASYEIMRPEDVGLSESRIVLTARSSRSAFRHRIERLGMKPARQLEDRAWALFQRLAETRREVTDADLRKLMAAAEGDGVIAPEAADDSHVADALRHLIFG